MSTRRADTLQIQNYLGSIQLALGPSREMEKVILEGGIWSSENIQLIGMLVREGDYALDVGANAGLITLPLARAVGASGRAIAFEPDSTSLAYLRRNIALNPDLAARITVEDFGLGSQFAELFVYHDTDGGNAYLSAAGDPKFGQVSTSEPEPCKVISLDEYCGTDSKALARLDFIKLDVEGMENLVLRGARKTLARFKPTVLLETLVRCFPGKDIRECESILRSLGYHLFAKQPEGKLIPSSFPALGEDTVAIHQDRLILCVHAMINAVSLRIDKGPLSSAKVWVSAVQPGSPLIRIDCAEGQIACDADLREPSEIVLSISTPNDPGPHVYALQLDQLIKGSPAPEARYSLAGAQAEQIHVEICEGDKLIFW